MDDPSHKPHRKAKEKKKQTGDRNPKAFGFSNPGKGQRAAARSSDIKEKRLHVPLVDRLPEEAPPRLVALVGPPGVGKSTLLRSLVRRYTKENISDPVGPITVVTSRKQRLTFIECPNELEAMVDVAKVADIVLLMIDGNYGFEMETMEFLNILASTGMPGNVFGILTHLDLFRKPSTLKDAKKRLKHRLWSELYQGAHLFYLSGIINGRYPDREVHNLSRFISVMKNPRPLVFRNTHCYTVADNFRDITHPTKIEEDEKCDRTIVLSGYLRGTNFSAEGQRVHIPGLGDYTVSSIEALPDPCPSPAIEQAIAKATGRKARRRLDEKEKKLHAPLSDRHGLKIEGDAIWITRERGFDLNKEAAERERGEGEDLIIGLQAERKLLGQSNDGIALFSGGERVAADDDTGRKSQRTARIADKDADDDGDAEGEEFDSADDEAGSGDDVEFNEQRLGKMFRKQKEQKEDEDDVAFADSDSDLGSMSGEDNEEGSDPDEDSEDDDEEASAVRWKEKMAERAAMENGDLPSYRTADLARLMYDESLTSHEVLQRWRGEVDAGEDEAAEAEGSDDEEFFKKAKEAEDTIEEDRALPLHDYEQLAAKWSLEDNIELLRQRFTTATLNGNKGGEDGSDDEDFDGLDEGDEGDGQFEDLEAGEDQQEEADEAATLEEERAKNAKRKEELRLRFEEEDPEGLNNDKAKARREGGDDEEFGEDDWYDAQKAQLQKQLDINTAEFEALDERQRVAVQGLKAGSYAKLVLDGIPAEFVSNFNGRLPIVVGGLQPTEERFGFVQVRIKRHRWHKKILKTNDPLILSLGWRRFQSMPIYSISDSRARQRMLKYTPEHMHCFATFYGPLIAPNTGLLGFNSFSSSNPGFRIAATGTVLSVDESTDVVKKLKLTGSPYKVFKNTAFIKDMFTSALEITKFEGAAIKTVSGIRGQIKKALSKPEGHFRATFEDKILMSDLVFLRTWYPIKPHRYYNAVTNLLGPWLGMRLTGEVRRDQGIPTPMDKNSKYRAIERPARHFNPVKVPRALAAQLPFKSQIVQMRPQRRQTYAQKRAVVLGGEEKKARDLMQKLTTVRKEQVAKRRAKKEETRARFRKKMEDQGDKKEAREKRESKDYWRREGKKRKAGDEGGGGKRQR